MQEDQKTIIVMAGYEEDMDRMLRANSGLASRMVKIRFPDFAQEQCVDVFLLMLQKLKGNFKLDATARAALPTVMRDLLDTFGAAADFANGRSVQNYLFKVRDAYLARASQGHGGPISAGDLQLAWTAYQDENFSSGPGNATPRQDVKSQWRAQARTQGNSMSPPPAATHDHKHAHAHAPDPGTEEGQAQAWGGCKRDADASDADWAQVIQALEEKKRLEEQRRREEAALREAAERARLEAEAARRAEEEAKRRKAAAEEQARLREQARLAQERAKAARDAEERRVRELERERQKEAAIQSKIRRIGKCVQGFDWLKVPGGYRCSGGSHVITDAEVRATD